MITIDDDLVSRLATLSKLQFDEAASTEIKADLEKILGFFEQISELDTDEVQPLVYMNEEHNVFRADEVKRLISKTEALKNAPKKDENFILVPKVIDK